MTHDRRPRLRPIRQLALFGASCLAACAHYQPRPIDAAVTALAHETRTLADSGLQDFIRESSPERAQPWPRPTWDLAGLTLVAFYYHPEIETARARLAGAEAAILTAGARPNPSAGFSPTYHGNPAAGVSPWTLGFSLDVPIETAGKRGDRIAQAQQLANAARLNVVNTAWQIRSRVRQSLLDLYAADTTRELLAQQQEVQNQTVGRLEERFQAGQVSLTEVQIVRIAAAQTALQLREAEKQSAQARVRLADALGVSVGAIENGSFDLSMFAALDVSGDPAALRREALLNRPDILGALAEYDASESALRLEIAKQYPDVHLGPGYAWDQGENTFSLGLSVALPVFNRNQGPIAESEAHVRQAAAAFLAVQASVIRDVDSALVSYRDSSSKLKTADSLLADQRRRMQLMQESFDAGASDRVELLQTRLELNSGELERANALIEAQQALGALEEALRRPANDTNTTTIPPALLKP